MSDRAPRSRKESNGGKKTHRAEARRFLGTHMQQAMIRGLNDEERARAWLGVANAKYQEGEIGKGIVENIAEKVRQANE